MLKRGVCLCFMVFIGLAYMYLSCIKCTGKLFSKFGQFHMDEKSTTIVTAYYPFPKSKHSLDEYKQWMENLLSYTQNPMVIYTSKQMSPFIQQLRNQQSATVCKANESCFPTVIINDFETPWEIPPIQSVKDKLYSQKDIDPEKGIHSPDLYAVWNAKAWMVENVAIQNPFNTRFFFWIDVGAYRSTGYRFGSWPDREKIGQIFDKQHSRSLLLGLIHSPSPKLCTQRHKIEDGPIVQDLIEGTFFGGAVESIRWWSQLYYKTLNQYIDKNVFAGKDQTIMNGLAFAFPERIKIIMTFKLQCGDPWFAFGPLLANHSVKGNSVGNVCQATNLSSVVVPFMSVCFK